MKLVRFSTNGQTPRLGVLQGDRIADLQASLAASLTRRGVSRAAELAAALVPNSTRAFLEGGSLAEEAVADIKEWVTRSEEHTSELQSRFDLVCRLPLEKKNWR